MRAMRVATRPITCPAASTTNHPPPCSICSVSRPRGTYVRMCSVTPFHVETNVNNKGYARICQRAFARLSQLHNSVTPMETPTYYCNGYGRLAHKYDFSKAGVTTHVFASMVGLR